MKPFAQMGYPHCLIAIICGSVLAMFRSRKETWQPFTVATVQELSQELSSPEIRLVVICKACVFFLSERLVQNIKLTEEDKTPFGDHPFMLLDGLVLMLLRFFLMDEDSEAGVGHSCNTLL
jgi:hypothetical protein